MLHRIRFIMPVFTLLMVLALQAAHAAKIQLPQTGQTGCWDVSGYAIACAGTGQDGDKKVGVASPVPRFTDNNNGTVTDNLTSLIWLKNANCFGSQTWPIALNLSNTLASGSSENHFTRYHYAARLQTKREVMRLANVGLNRL